jgi:hypothetical protein
MRVSAPQTKAQHLHIKVLTSAYVSRRQQTSAYVSIRQHTSAYVCMHTRTARRRLKQVHVHALASVVQQRNNPLLRLYHGSIEVLLRHY